MEIAPAEVVTAQLANVWSTAVKELRRHRGGHAFYESQWGDLSSAAVLAELVEARDLFVAIDEGEIVGFAAVRDGVIEGLFVDGGRRRQGVARSLVSYLLAMSSPPRDAQVLPGDRGMKSLFESFGWKARLLTMRGE